MSTVYQVNKGVNKPIEFRGLYGQYIAYLAVGLVGLLLLFIGLYLLGAGLIVTMPLVFGLGGALFYGVNTLSKRFGVHGLQKFWARKGLPIYVRCSSRRVFLGLRVGLSNAERQSGEELRERRKR